MQTFSTINSLALRLRQSNADTGPRSELLSDGAPTALTLDGAVLEAALRWHDCYVVFLSDDIPSEDALHIHLLATDFRLLDTASLASMYSTGSFAALHLLPPDRLSFRFFGDAIWTLELLAQPQMRLPFLSEPRGVTRPFGFSRRMIIRGDPKPG